MSYIQTSNFDLPSRMIYIYIFFNSCTVGRFTEQKIKCRAVVQLFLVQLLKMNKRKRKIPQELRGIQNESFSINTV